MDTALVVAGISAVVAIASAALSTSTQFRLATLTLQRETRTKEEERRSAAKVALDKYRGPLLDAAWHLGDRIDNLRHRGFLTYLSDVGGRADDARLSTLFRLASYFGWREFIRVQVQLMRFENSNDTKLVAGLLGDVSAILATDQLDDARAMLWVDEQRGIGELMTEPEAGTSFLVRGHASFYRDYQATFAPWMERLAADVLSSDAVRSDRLRLLQWALCGLVRQLDEEEAYRTGWISRTFMEIREGAPQGPTVGVEQRLRERLAQIERS